MEKRLQKIHGVKHNKNLYLYDVTSSYLEGECNELAEYGYNRDKKKGKKQIVIGLLTNSEGLPVATRVFKGNTSGVVEEFMMSCMNLPVADLSRLKLHCTLYSY